MDGNPLLVAVVNYFFDIGPVPGVNHKIGKVFHNAAPEPQDIFHGFTRGVEEPGVGCLVDISRADNFRQGRQILRGKVAGKVLLDLAIPGCNGPCQVPWVKVELGPDQVKKPFGRMLEPVGSSPFKYRTKGAGSRRCIAEFGRKRSLFYHVSPWSRMLGAQMK
jgi:hypothetical protein